MTNSRDYEVFETNLRTHFTNAIEGDKEVFKTNVQGLYDVYLRNLPVEDQATHSCNACRHFIDRFGGLVTIDEQGNISPVMWNGVNTPPMFEASVSAMREEILKSEVTGVFVAEGPILGHPLTGEWTHLSVTVPTYLINNSAVNTAGQTMAEMREEFKMLTNALLDFSLNTVDQAVALLQSETIYRSDRFLGIAEWFQALHVNRNRATGSKNKENIVWQAVATAPPGFCHIRSSMIGTLLEDIDSRLSAASITRRFEEKMNTYMRSQSSPSENAIYEAEKIVAKHGITDSLQRRFASIDEIPEFLWQDQSPTEIEKDLGGVFGHIIPKDKAVSESMSLPETVMTWIKFQRTVLSTAESIEVLVDNAARFMAMVTAVNPTAPNILQWNNPYSWYYYGGIDGEIKRRVEEFGGRHENNEIRVSLIWDGLTDLDLHCVTPHREHIYWSKKQTNRCSGYLDLDMNGVDKQSENPVENMRWADYAPEGHYKFYVHNYSERVNGNAGTPFIVELEINGQVHHYQGEALIGGQEITVFEFDYYRNQDLIINNSSVLSSSEDVWGVTANSFVKVNSITSSPNLWGEETVAQSGNHVFFLLDGVKDLSEGKGRGFFNEMLKSDFRAIRKTLEAYTANTPIQGAEEATACGVGYSKDNDWGLTVRVTSNKLTRVVKIDRWD